MIQVGLLGFGLSGRCFHAAFIQAVEGLSLTKVMTSRPVDSALYPGARVVPRAADILDDPSIDLVVVATPNDQHVDEAEAALSAGKHVVLEKPVAPSLAAFERLTGYAPLLIPFQNRRYDGDFLTVAGLLREGVLGRVRAFESVWPKYRPVPAPRAGWKAAPGATSGVLWDLGPHLVDQAVALFGAPRAVRAELAARHGPVVDAFALELVYADGPRVRLEVDHLDPFPGPRFKVRGDLASYEKRGLDPQDEALRAGAAPTDENWGRAEHDGRLVGRDPAGAPVDRVVPTEPGDYRRFYLAVRDAILGVGPSPVPLEDVRIQLRILAAAEASGGDTVEV